MHADIAVSRREAQHIDHAAGLAVQRDELVFGQPAGPRGLGQVGAVPAAVADGHVHVAAGQRVGRDALGQQSAHARGQVGEPRAALGLRPVVHGHRGERRHHVHHAGPARQADLAGQPQAEPAGGFSDAVAQDDQQAAVALGLDAPVGMTGSGFLSLGQRQSCWAARAYLANSDSIFLKALNSRALPDGSRKNMVACSPTSPLKRM